MGHGIRWGRLSIIGLIIALIAFLAIKPFIGSLLGGVVLFFGSITFAGLAIIGILAWCFIAWRK